MVEVMKSKTERVIVAATAITLASATGMVGAGVGAALVDYAIQKLGKREDKKK